MKGSALTVTSVGRLPTGWQVLSLGEMLAEPVRNGIYKSKEFHGRGARVVNMGELFAHEFISDQEMKRVELTSDEQLSFALRDGDLLFARRSLVLEGSGKCSLVVKPSQLTTFESSIIRARPNRRVAEPRFLFYLFASPFGRATVASIASQTAVSGIRGSDLARLELPLPPLRLQRRIAHILSAYDELIENSQRRIRIMDTMARTLYHEWSMEHDAVKCLGELAEEVRSNVPKGALRSALPYVGLEHIPRRSIALDDWETVAELGSNKLEFKKGDILFGKIRPYFHKVSIAPFDGVCSADTIVIRPKEPKDFAAVAACVSSDAFVAHATATSNGAKMPRANWDVLKEFRVPLPSPSVMSEFSLLFNSTVAQQQVLIFQIKNLRHTRNFLLPRLLSGQLSLTATTP